MANRSGSSIHHSDDRKNKPDDGRNYIAVARGSDLVVIRVVGKGNMINAPALADFADEQRKAGFSRFVFDMERCQGLDSTFMGVMVGMHASVAGESGAFNKVADEPVIPHTPKDEPAAQIAAAGVTPDELAEMTPLSPEEAVRALEERFHGKPDAAEQPLKEEVVAEPEPIKCDGLISAVNVPPSVLDLMAMLGVDKFVKMRGNCDLRQLEMTVLPEKQIPATERRRLILKAHETLVEIDKRNEVQFGAFLKTLSAELGKEG